MKRIFEFDSYVIDENNNIAFYDHFGSKEKAIEAIERLINCKNCINANWGRNFDMSLYDNNSKVYFDQFESDDLYVVGYGNVISIWSKKSCSVVNFDKRIN